MDNKIFNVNGRTRTQLAKALELLLLDEYGDTAEVKGWYFSKDKGLVLTWHVQSDKRTSIAFTDRMGKPSPISGEELVNIIWDWLKTDEAQTVVCEGTDAKISLDGSVERGWRLYTEKWGHIELDGGVDSYSIAAIKPAWLWYNK